MTPALEKLLAELEHANNNRTQGEWKAVHERHSSYVQSPELEIGEDGYYDREDAAFIVLSANNMKKLIEIIRVQSDALSLAKSELYICSKATVFEDGRIQQENAIACGETLLKIKSEERKIQEMLRG